MSNSFVLKNVNLGDGEATDIQVEDDKIVAIGSGLTAPETIDCTGLVALPIADALPQTTIHLFARTDGPLTLPTQRLKDSFEQEAKALRRERKA